MNDTSQMLSKLLTATPSAGTLAGLGMMRGQDPATAWAQAMQVQAMNDRNAIFQQKADAQAAQVGMQSQEMQRNAIAQQLLGEAVDPQTGMIRPEAIARVMQVSPTIGMKLQSAYAKQQQQMSKQTRLVPVTDALGNVQGFDPYTNTLTPAGQAGAGGQPIQQPMPQGTAPQGGEYKAGYSDFATQFADSSGGIAPQGAMQSPAPLAPAGFDPSALPPKAQAEFYKRQAIANAPLSPTDQAAVDERNAKAKREQENAAAKKQERMQAKADTRLADESALSAMDEGLGYIDALVGNPEKGIAPHAGFSSAVGSKVLQPDYAFGINDTPFEGSDSAGFLARQEQIQGGAFLTAVQKMRGLGALTEKEGDKAQASIIRMKDSVSEKEYIAAANDYRAVMNGARSRLVKKMQGTGQADTKGGGLESISTEQLQQMLMEAK
jgi:hypothetical protein